MAITVATLAREGGADLDLPSIAADRPRQYERGLRGRSRDHHRWLKVEGDGSSCRHGLAVMREGVRVRPELELISEPHWAEAHLECPNLRGTSGEKSGDVPADRVVYALVAQAHPRGASRFIQRG